VFNASGFATLAVCVLAPNDLIQDSGLAEVAGAVCHCGHELSRLLGYGGAMPSDLGESTPEGTLQGPG
jgi:hypothetical protein